MTEAHTQDVETRTREYFPAHEAREHDSHYHLFTAARKRLKAAGKLVCWICGKDEKAAGAPIQLHHSLIEFALANGVDVAKFSRLYPEFRVQDEETFLAFVEGEGNLTPLCADHHVGIHGIHAVVYPAWIAQRVWKDDLPAPAEIER